MGQMIKPTLYCGCDCLHTEKEKSCTVNYTLHYNAPIASLKEIESSPISFPKLKKVTSKNLSGEDIDDTGCLPDNRHIKVFSDISGSILQNDIQVQKTGNTSNIPSNNSIAKTLDVKSKEFNEHLIIEKSPGRSKDNAEFIQAVIKGRTARRKFLAIKSKLKIQSEAISNNILVEYNKSEFKSVEAYAPHAFSIDEYLQLKETKDFIPATSDELIAKNKTLVFLFNGMNALYCGSLNMFNERHGYGVLYTPTEKYEGHWIRNSFTGWGRIVDIKDDKSVIEGVFTHWKLNGYGRRYWVDKSYRGEFTEDQMEGHGIEECNVYYFEGHYSHNSKNGKGRIAYLETGDVYEGDFIENCLTGFGLYIWSNKHTYLGEFLNGNMHGQGKYEWPEGGYYEGQYKDNIKEGNGVFKWPDGKIYTGPFINGQPDGIGKLFSKNKELEVEFKAGKIVNSKKK